MYSQSSLYINRVSATILALIKIVEAVVAGYCLVHVISLLVSVIDFFAKGVNDMTQYLDLMTSEFGFSQEIYDASVKSAVGVVTIPFGVILGILGITVIALLLVVIEGIATLTLRFAKRGALVIRGIRRFYLVLSVLNLVLFAYLAVLYIINFSKISQAIGETGAVGLNVVMIAVGVITLVILILQFCYHKDIARAMTTVDYEIEYDRPGDLKRTHLSGISFIFALPSTILLVVWVVGIVTGYIPVLAMERLSMIMSIVTLAVMMLKQYSICFCNRNLKNARSYARR